MNKGSIRRYPGVKPFDQTERELFFGRDRDIEDMLDLVYLEKLVVLFGKSGYGKSSLVNAGILPRLDAGFVSIVMRLGVYVAGQTRAPLETLRLKLEEVLSSNPDAAFLDKLSLPNTLWLFLKRCQNSEANRFFLVFDQFEEFFTHPESEQNAFKKQLAELLYTEIPQVARNQVGGLSPEQQTLLATPFDIKALFVIRSDRLSQLDSMKDKLPAILHKRYELQGLGTAQAREAVVRPAQAEGDKFISPKFSFADDALQKILGDLSPSDLATRKGIEAFQLQILCQYIENKAIERKTEGLQIEKSDLPDIANIYEAYYKRQIARLDPAEQELAQKLIEDGLLFEDAVTGEARRLSVDVDALAQQFGVSKKLFEDLENSFLLRRETNTLGGFNYEISHDTLVASIWKSKIARKAKEEKLENERKRLKAEKKAQQEETLRLDAERRRRKAKWVAVAAVVAFILAAVAGLGALRQWQIAKVETKKAEQALADYRKEVKLRFNAEVKKREIERKQFEQTLQDVEAILKANGCPEQEQLQQLDTFPQLYPEDSILQRRIRTIRQKIRNNQCQ